MVSSHSITLILSTQPFKHQPESSMAWPHPTSKEHASVQNCDMFSLPLCPINPSAYYLLDPRKFHEPVSYFKL